MRALGLALLVGATGCDLAFGLQPRDAAPPAPDVVDSTTVDPDAAWLPMRLTRQVLESDGTISYPAIAGAVVEAGPIDPATPLRTLAVAADGTFLVGRDDPSQEFRLVYTADGDVPTELHSTLVGGHFVVPLFGHADRVPPPAGAIVTFMPSVAPATFTDALIFTTGLWTRTDQGAVTGPSRPVAYTTTAVSLSGALGSLASAQSDTETLVNCDANGVALGFATMSVTSLVANGSVTASSTWSMPGTTSLRHTDTGPTQAIARLMRPEVLGPLYKNVPTTRSWGGVIASTMMPSFAKLVPGGVDESVFLDLSHELTSPHRFVNPFTAQALPTALLRRNIDTRMRGGVALSSGFQEVALVVNGGTTDVLYDAGIARNVRLAGTVLSGSADGAIVPFAGAPLVDLTFDTDKPVDDCVVTLYTVGATSLTAVRRFLVQQPPAVGSPLKIDATLFPSQPLVLGIVCRAGYPNVAQGDYTVVHYPFSTATVYPAAFTITR